MLRCNIRHKSEYQCSQSNLKKDTEGEKKQ